LLGNVVIQ